ncbi:hypothetical protein MHU86_23673 [Fragilaria crotonensis]|nr:hypothetical protein MHU86_23673 [Fragilaria crotonensis]
MTSKKPKGAVKFHQDWEVKYAVQVCTRDPVSKDVCSVVCLMCTNFGREDDAEAAERKRKRTSNDKYYTAPWRTDNFVSHLRKQHAVMWEEYRKLAPAEKVHFFAVTESPERVNLRSFVQPEASLKAQIIAKQKCSFVIDGDIVSKLILELLLTPTIEGRQDVLDEGSASASSNSAILPEEESDGGSDNEFTNTELYATLEKKRILKMFVYTAEDDVYTVKVKSVLKLNMVASFVEIGVSFRQARRIYQAVKEQTGMGHLGSVSDGEVAQLCRIVCAINLQYLKELFKKVWAFSIGLDAGNNAGSSYLDIRMRCLFKGDIQNLHLLAIPMRERHTGEYQANLVVSLLDVLAPNWRHQLIGIATDVEEQALVSEFFFYNSYYVTRIKTAEAIEEAGMMVQTELDKLKEDGGIATGSPYHGVLKAVSTFALTIVEGVTKIVAEQGVVEDDDAARRVVDEIPPVLPVDLCSMAPRAFSAILQNQRNRLLEKVSEEDIENIDAQFRRLRIVYREDEGMKLRLDANHSASKVQSFKDSWSPLGKDFDALKEFCGGLASVMPGTSSVESDFSLINWTKDPHSKSLTDFSLEAILHCKQYKTLEGLFT